MKLIYCYDKEKAVTEKKRYQRESGNREKTVTEKKRYLRKSSRRKSINNKYRGVKMSQVKIRMADLEDAKAVYDIYEPYILNTVITFEYDKVPVGAFRERMKKVMEKFPWLVCEIDGEIAGYAYCSPHLERAAFAWDCECSVYLNEKYHRRGIGTALYDALFQIVKKQGVYNIYSLICVPHESSVALHKKYGFSEVGTYYNTAYKLGRWRHLLVMEKRLEEALGEPKPVISIHNIDKAFLENEFRKAEKTVILG